VTGSVRHLSPAAATRLRRAARRRTYAAYMASGTWQRRRRAWLRHWRATHPDADPVCVVCERTWTLNDDLHHANYDQLGHEPDNDLVPMCKPCSKALHRILERSGHLGAIPPRAATASIITNLRRIRRTPSDGVSGG
jgi:hypothetical protein